MLFRCGFSRKLGHHLQFRPHETSNIRYTTLLTPSHAQDGLITANGGWLPAYTISHTTLAEISGWLTPEEHHTRSRPTPNPSRRHHLLRWTIGSASHQCNGARQPRLPRGDRLQGVVSCMAKVRGHRSVQPNIVAATSPRFPSESWTAARLARPCQQRYFQARLSSYKHVRSGKKMSHQYP